MRCSRNANFVIRLLVKFGIGVALALAVGSAPVLAEEVAGSEEPEAATKSAPVTKPRGAYITGEIGGNVAGAAETSVTLPGFRLSVAGGYNFNRWVGLELETGYIYGSSDDTTVSQMPFVVNFVVRYEGKTKWVPYVGAGLGGIIVWGDSGGTSGTAGDGVYQLMGGLRRVLNEQMSLGLSYKYLGYTVSSLLIDRRIGNHSLSLGLNYKF
jgi:opacity protein-like surface antigen